MTVWTCDERNVTSDQKTEVERLLKGFGDEHFVAEEHFIDLATALSGSGGSGLGIETLRLEQD